MADSTKAAELLKSLLPKSPWFDESWKNAYRSCGQDVKESEMIFRENLVKYDVYCKGHGSGWECPVELRPPSEDEVCELRFFELESNGENWVGFEAQDRIDEGKIIWELPATDGVYWETWFTNGNNDPDGDDESTLQWGWSGTGNTFLGREVIAGGNATGGYDTYIGYQAGYYSTSSTANVVVGAGAGKFIETTYTVDPDVTYTFTRRRKTSVGSEYMLSVFGDYLVTVEHHLGPPQHRHFLRSLDGVNWSEWFSIDGSADYMAYEFVEFSDKLYINWYDSDPDPRIQIWDGNAVTTTLTAPAQHNLLAGSMHVYGSKLWVVTDVTPSANDKRVVHWTADGAAWTAVTDYDGATYLAYNFSSGPLIGGRPYGSMRGNRWVEYGGKLYLFASTYNTTNLKWMWEIWEAGTTTFTKIYDTSALNDDYAISTVVTNGSIIIVTGQKLDGSRNYTDACKIYRSTNLTDWTGVSSDADYGVFYGAIEYGNMFYFLVHDSNSPNYNRAYYWDDSTLTLVQCGSTITTDAAIRSGNIVEYKGSFFIGKWNEIYELIRVKSATITVTDATASGNTIVGASAGDMPIAENLNCLFGYNSNLSNPEVRNGIAIGAYSRVSRDNMLILGGTDTYQVDVAIGRTYAMGRLDVHQYGAKESTNYGVYVQNEATNETHDSINKYGVYVSSTGTFTGSTGTACNNYGIYVDAITGGDTNYGIYSEDNITTEDQFISSLADGTKPIDVTSETVCTHLNADMLDGYHAASFAASTHKLLSATHDDTTADTVVLGDIIYGDATPKWVRLAGQTTAVKQYLSQTGNGAISAVPAWATIAQADITGLKTSDSPTFAGLTIGSLGGILLGTAGVVSAITNNSANWDTAYGWGDHSVEGYLKSVTAHNILSTTHGDTTVSAPNNGDVLTWNSGTSKWVAAAAAGGAVAFLDLTDVDEADYTGHAAQFVVVNGTEDGLVFSASSVAGHDLGSASHTDVNAAAPSDDDILRYDSGTSKWVAEALPAASNHDLLSATHADTLASAVSRGSLIYGNDTPKWAELVVGATGYVLTSDGTDVAWADPAHAMLSATHSDSTASAVSRGSVIIGDDTPKWKELAVGSAGQALVTDGTDVSWGAPTAAAHNLLSAQHGDTTSSNPNNGDVITWDAGTGKWKAAAPGVGALALDDLSDVSASSPSDGDSLVWDSTTSKWIPEAVAGGGGAPTDAQYVTLAVNGTLSAERVLTAGAGITLTDAGAGSTVTLAGNPDVMTRHDWIHEHFDALTTGSILGQGSYNEVGAWQDDGLAAGSTAVVAVKSGSDKMLTITNKAAAGATNSYIGAVLTSALGFEAGGRLHFKFRLNQDASGYGGRVAFTRDATNQTFSIYFRYNTTFQIAYSYGSAGYKIQNALKDTWYTVDAFWIYGRGHIYINGTPRYSFTSAATGYKWDRVSISSYSPAGGNDCVLDVDDLIVSSILPLGITV